MKQLHTRFLKSSLPINNFNTSKLLFSSQAQTKKHKTVIGSVASHLDLASVRIGETLEIPYEITISDHWRESWQSVFYEQDRIHTSKKFCEAIGLNAIPMPFNLILFLCTSMSHVDDTRNVFDLAFRNCVYQHPAFPGDTLHRNFIIENIRESRNNKNIIVDIHCNLYNQNNTKIFKCDKTMYFEKLQLPKQLLLSAKQGNPSPPILDFKSKSSYLKSLILASEHKLTTSTSLRALENGELLLHTFQRPLGMTASMSLCTQHRMTHPALYNTQRYTRDQIIVAGVNLIGLTHAASAKELYEVLYEDIIDAHILTKCSPDEPIGALTYVRQVQPISEKLEEVEVVTLGVKNIDVSRDLVNIKIPLDLFEPGIKPKECLEICETEIPQLQDKIVVSSTRRLIRQKPPSTTMALL